MLKQRLILGVSSLALASVISTNVVAQGAIDEIVVTAREEKRELTRCSDCGECFR